MSRNVVMLAQVAKGLGEMVDEVVFVGGSVTELYADDPASTDIRSTLDIDCVIEISSRLKYYELEERLRAKKFNNDTSYGAPVCRWRYEGIVIDVMPIDDDILGFSNQWYKGGVEYKRQAILPDGTNIYIFTAPYYLGAKFEAVISRGGTDLRISHDFEDIIYVLDNTTNIIEQISSSELNLREYLTEQFNKLLNNSNIEETIECALPYGAEERVEYIIGILKWNYIG
ncbi:MAG: hypothetical protein R3Y26_07510 [Rikenellaceae bacterium]